MDSAVIVAHFPDCAIVKEGSIESVRVSGGFFDKARVCTCGGTNVAIEIYRTDGDAVLIIPTGGRA